MSSLKQKGPFKYAITKMVLKYDIALTNIRFAMNKKKGIPINNI